MNKSTMKKYAYTICKVGANIQKGQDVCIYINTDLDEFAKYLVEAAYKVGAGFVRVFWQNDDIAIIRNKKESLKSLSLFRDYEKAEFEYQLKNLPVRIYIESSDPDGLNKIDHLKDAKARQARYPFIKEYRQAMDCKYQWVIAGYPSKAWAKKVFPTLKTHEALKKLEEAILYVTRIDEDPIKAWEKHNTTLEKYMNILNDLHLDHLHYKANNGTDFTVWLNDNGVWLSGGEKTLGTNIFYNPNMPTEEVFVTPKAGKVEGKVVASKPLSYNGKLIENFSFVFENGKVKECHAEKNEDVLKQMIQMDEGASRLGEVALVPYESPINQTGILFFNTLYDENAVCHLALGVGFPNCFKDYEKYSYQEIIQMGMNDSMIHVDFMIGTRDLEITGYTKDNQEVAIFKNGTWVL